MLDLQCGVVLISGANSKLNRNFILVICNWKTKGSSLIFNQRKAVKVMGRSSGKLSEHVLVLKIYCNFRYLGILFIA